MIRKTTSLALAGSLVAVLLAVPGTIGPANAQDEARGQAQAELDANQIVPCLLPARVRRLGGLVYPERRQLTRTTVRRCELRGGEYTAYDRAEPEAAAGFFLPLAESGDPDAQLSIGEVYEYLFDEPRYADAAAWYRRAAEQGNRTAMRRLAHLHEHGLGVAADPLRAANLWRQATGAGEALVLASELEAARTAAQERIDALMQELSAKTADAEALRLALHAGQQALAERREALAQAESEAAELQRQLAGALQAAPAESSMRIAALTRELDSREQLIEEQSFQIASMEAALSAQGATLAASARQLELENQRLERELARVSARSDAELAEARAALADKTDELAALQAEQRALAAQLETRTLEGTALAAARNAAGALAERVSVAERESEALRRQLDAALDDRRRLEAELAATESRLVAAEQRLAAADGELALLRAETATVLAEREALRQALTLVPPDRTDEIAALRQDLAARERQIEAQTTRIAEMQTQTELLRAEADGLRGQWGIQLATRGAIEPLPDTSGIRMPRDVPMGRYHALVIGNNNYENLTSLRFAHNDATAMHEMLSQQYGFESELVLDATRTEIFRRIEALDGRIRSEDALLIYYAGHGVEERRISYWLGVDAPSTRGSLQTYGLSSAELGQWLSVLEARHVLVIADSCYSGAGIETTGGMKFNVADVEQQLRFYLQNRSRTTLTSGGNVPVPDGGAGDHSVFTRALLGLLEENRGILFDADIYARLKERVKYGQNAVIGVPTPVFGRIEVGGHGAGQFVFIRPGVVRS
jgi:uncharacterized caspase-like protein